MGATIDKASRRWMVAVHESAHKVAAEKLGWTVRYVRIICDGDEGIAQDRAPLLRDKKRKAIENAVIALAGVEANIREAGHRVEPYGLVHDRQDAARFLRPYFHDISLPQIEMQARTLVNAHWSTIQRVAARLYVAGEL